MTRNGIPILSILLAGCAQSIDPAVVSPALDPAALVASHVVLLQAASDADNFRFPSDKGGGLLAQTLRPSERIPGTLSDVPSIQKNLTGARGLENPQVPLSPGPADLPRRPLEPKAIAVLPRTLGEGAPLAGYREDPVGPTRATLATGVPVSLPSVDVNLPAPLPALNTLTADRVPFDDPSAAASRQTALSATPPVRVNPVPFAPENLPDPFANAQTIRLRQPPAENPQPRP